MTDRPMIDWADSLPLADGDALAACVEPDGSTSLWVVRPLCATHEGDVVHGSLSDADHERLGRLPSPIQQRLDHALRPRCGEPTADGRPCRQHVGSAGAACHWHREALSREVAR
jgi:hypothetical protein